MKKTLAKILALALCAVLLVTGTVFVTLAYLQDYTKVVKNTFSASGITLTLDESLVNKDGVPGKMVDGGNGEKVFKTLDELKAEDSETYANATADRIPNDTSERIGNEYRLVPGATYTKDPVVHVKGGSEACYVYVAIKNTMFPNDQHLANKTISTQLTDNGWVPMTGEGVKQDYLDEIGWADNSNVSIYYFNKAEVGNGPNLNITCATADKIDAREVDDEETIDIAVFESFKIKTDLDAQALVTATENGVIEIVAFAMQTEGFTDAVHAWTSTFGALSGAT